MERAKLIERTNYKPSAPCEEFIVPLLRKHIEHVLSNYGKPSKLNAIVLDVGCGSQPFRKELEKLGYTYKSIDAQQNLEETVDTVWEIDKPLPNDLLSFASFDFIFCTEVMEHVADWNIAFENFAQLLAPGGKLFITCPHFYILHEEPYDFWRPTPYALKYFGDKYEFQILHQVNAGDAWDVIGTAIASSYTIPASKRISDRIISKIVSIFHNFIYQVIASRLLQSTINLHSSLYLSNIVVFQK